MTNQIRKITENTFEITTRRGDVVTVHFTEDDNPDIENIITDNLMTSYEKRMGKTASENFNKI